MRMRDDHRYGVSLSGGLDSRSVLAAVNEDKKDVVAFTYGIKDCDDAKIAEKVSKRVGAKYVFIEINPSVMIENAEKCIYITDGRDYIGVSYGIPMHERAKTYMDVMFDGFALDLTLGGSYLDGRILHCENEKELLNVLQRKRRLFNDEELAELFHQRFMTRIKDSHHRHFLEIFNKINDVHPANKSDHFFLRMHVSNIPIFYSMVRNFIETAYPTTDNNFIDIILTIPPELRFNHRIYRKFLKKLSPELARLPYNQTMIRADAPLFLWKLCVIFQHYKELIKSGYGSFLMERFIFPAGEVM